jgi:hypothetical protein
VQGQRRARIEALDTSAGSQEEKVHVDQRIEARFASSMLGWLGVLPSRSSRFDPRDPNE